MKENIKVCVRIRPEDNVESCLSRIGEGITITSGAGSNNTVDEHAFHFDKIFGTSSTQPEVFSHVESFVESAIDGYNSTIFAFGMTGSGKTHTITGEKGENNAGVVPRAVHCMFDQIRRRNEANPEQVLILYLSCVELYNNMLYDLLESRPLSTSNSTAPAPAPAPPPPPLHFKPTSLKVFEHPIKGSCEPSISVSTLYSPH